MIKPADFFLLLQLDPFRRAAGAVVGVFSVAGSVALQAGFTSANCYTDNFTLTANPLPEPAAAGLTVLAPGGRALRPRR